MLKRRLTLLACLGALGAIAAGRAQDHPAPSSPPAAEIERLGAEVRGLGWICFSARSERGDWDLFGCRPDGSGLRALTRTPALSEFSPQFSQDGRRLLYRRVPRSEQLDNNRHGEQGELVLARADATAPVALGKAGELGWASFSPDGTHLATLSIKGIGIFNLDQREIIRTLPRQGFFQQMTWSPDGRWLCGVANSFGAGWSIARMDLATGKASAVNRVDCCTPDWFPDSRDLIFSWRPPGQRANQGYGWTQLWRASADGTSRQLVYAEEGRHTYGGHVSPDGRYVLFTGNMEEDGDPGRAGAPMALMRLSDAPIIVGESRELRARHPETRSGPVLALPPGWEPCWTSNNLPRAPAPATTGQGASGAASTRSALPSASREPHPLAAELHAKGWLVFSGRTPAGDWDVFAMRPDGSDRRQLTNTRAFSESGARLSPDGTRLLYYRQPRAEPLDNNTYGTYDLVLANADGSHPEVLGNGFTWATWGPDGRQFACLGPKGIRIIDVGTRAVIRELPRRGIVSQLGWSPDGRWFTGTANGLGPFWTIGCLDADTGAIHAVSETDRYNCTADWAPDAEHIVYARGIIPQQPGHAELWVARADGTERRRVHAEAGHHLYGACVSPDGGHVVFTRSTEDLGQVPAIEMAILRWPQRGGATGTESGACLDLGPGWEPHWTAKEIVK